jgi:hypothetical protein
LDGGVTPYEVTGRILLPALSHACYRYSPPRFDRGVYYRGGNEADTAQAPSQREEAIW